MSGAIRTESWREPPSPELVQEVEDVGRTSPLAVGATGNHADWMRETDVADLTAGLDLLVVMPDAGEWGWYSDWWNEGAGGIPAWETFHLEELRGILERDWRADDRRVITGVSMGGYGAIHYATAHPELFRAVASFSGVVDPNGTGRGLAIDLRAWGSGLVTVETGGGLSP